MASIRKRNDKWQVQICRHGCPPLNCSFNRRSDALEWARQAEIQADRRELPVDRKLLRRITLGDVVRRYLTEIVPLKRGADVEGAILRAFLREPMCQKSLDDVTTADFSAYRDRRLEKISSRSLARQLSPLNNMFVVARREWLLPVSNPLRLLTLNVSTPRRERRLRLEETEKLFTCAGRCRNKLILPLIEFALETGMRRGEILALRWTDIDLVRRLVTIAVSKNGNGRSVPLTVTAENVLCKLPRGEARAFPVSPNSLRLAWQRIRQRADFSDLHFHDLRHEAISRFFEMGLTVPEVASVSGHKDVRLLSVYAHARLAEIRIVVGSWLAGAKSMSNEIYLYPPA